MRLKFLLGLFAFFVSSFQALAVTTTFDFSSSVTSGPIGSGVNVFGQTGDSATASLTLTYSPGELIPVGPTSGGGVNFSITSPDFSYSNSFSPEGFNDGFNSSINASTTAVSFITSSGLFSWPSIAGNTLRTGFIFTYGTALGAAPTTYDALAAALSDPGTSLTFRTNGDFLFASPQNGVFDEYSATLRPTAVPLPAAGWMLIVALMGLPLLKRRPA